MSSSAIKAVTGLDTDDKILAYCRARFMSVYKELQERGFAVTEDVVTAVFALVHVREGVDATLYEDADKTADFEFLARTPGLTSTSKIMERLTERGLKPAFDSIVTKLAGNKIKVLVGDALSTLGTTVASRHENRDAMPPRPSVEPRQEPLNVGELLTHLHEFCVSNIGELMEFVRLGLFEGFNRRLIMQEAFRHLSNQAIFVIATLVALRGPVKVFSDEKILTIPVTLASGLPTTLNGLVEAEIIKPEKTRSGPRLKADSLTFGRINAAFADLAAFGMLQLQEANLISKRIADNGLPAFLQFPQAASLPMTEKGRRLHVEFSENFSELIKGTFSPTIYQQQATNIIHISGTIGKNLIDSSEGCLCVPGKNVAAGISEETEEKATEETVAETKTSEPPSASKEKGKKSRRRS